MLALVSLLTRQPARPARRVGVPAPPAVRRLDQHQRLAALRVEHPLDVMGHRLGLHQDVSLFIWIAMSFSSGVFTMTWSGATIVTVLPQS